MRSTNHTSTRQQLQVKHPLDSLRWAAVIAALGWSAAGCGSTASTGDGAATGAGGRADGGLTSTDGSSGGHGGHGAGGTNGVVGGASGTTTFADIGKACTADTDCTGGLACLTAGGKIIVGAEGPANGYCSKPCGTDADCGTTGLCLDVSATSATMVGYCFQTCTFGQNAPKCHARTDVGCLTLDATTTPTTDICYPVCSQDSDCPTGRKCNLADSLCADTPSTGDPLGTHCVVDPDASTTTCAAGCLPLGSGTDGGGQVASFCTMLCVVGNLEACNWAGAGVPLSTGGAHGVCGIAAQNAQIGDVGFCTQECDAVTDCSDKTDPGVSCDTSLMTTIGHGICSWAG
jgi:hypothetical protein